MNARISIQALGKKIRDEKKGGTCACNVFNSRASLLSITAFLGFHHLETIARFIDILDLADPDTAVVKFSIISRIKDAKEV